MSQGYIKHMSSKLVLSGLLSVLLVISVNAKAATINSESSIYIGKEATRVEDYAASELQFYLSKVLSHSVPICSEESEEMDNSIVIGTPNSNRIIAYSEGDLDLPEDNQGFVITPVSRNGKSYTVIASPGSKGVLYGVYELLEQMGVRFIVEGEDVIPDVDEFTLNKTVNQEPAFPKRGFAGVLRGSGDFQQLKTLLDWMARHRLNVLRLHRVPSPLLYSGTSQGSYEQVRSNQKLFRKAINYAQVRGINFILPFLRLEGRPHSTEVKPYITELFETFPEIKDVEISGLRSGEFYNPGGEKIREENYNISKIVEGAKAYQEAVNQIKPDLTSWIYFWGGALPDPTYEMAKKYEFTSTWNFHGKWDPSVDIPELAESLPEGIGFLLKDSYGDYGFADPPNPWITRIKKAPVMAVFASSAEYGGRKSMFYTKFNLWITEFKLFEKNNIPFVGVRRNWHYPVGEGHMYKRYGLRMFLINDIAYAKLAWDTETPEKQIWNYWASGVFPNAKQEVADVLENSEDIVVNSLYLGKRFISRGIQSINKLNRIWNNPWRRQKWLVGDDWYDSYDQPEYTGKSVPVDVIQKTMDKMMEQKNMAVKMANERLTKLKKYKTTLTEKQYLGLKKMLSEDKTVAQICRCYVKSFYLYQLIKNDKNVNSQELRSKLSKTAREMRQFSKELKAEEVDISHRNLRHQFDKSVMKMKVAGLSRYYEKFAFPDKEHKRYYFNPAEDPNIVKNISSPQSPWLSEKAKAKDDLWGYFIDSKGEKRLWTRGDENCPKLQINCSVPNGKYLVYLDFYHSLKFSLDSDVWHGIEYRRNDHALGEVEVTDGDAKIYIDDQVTSNHSSLVEVVLEKVEY
jgi:hypothetical protein